LFKHFYKTLQIFYNAIVSRFFVAWLRVLVSFCCFYLLFPLSLFSVRRKQATKQIADECRQHASKEGQYMNNLNFKQRQYIKTLMDLIADYKNFDDLPCEVVIALSFMTETKTSDKLLKDDVNSFMSAWEVQKTWNARKQANQ
jgi:hypothetical protein